MTARETQIDAAVRATADRLAGSYGKSLAKNILRMWHGDKQPPLHAIRQTYRELYPKRSKRK